jgi:type II secretory pathway component PulK
MTTQRREYRALRGHRRAAVLIVLILVMTVAVTLFGLWARQVISEQRRMETQAYRLQAVRLAEAGVQRILAIRASDLAAHGESWPIPPDQLDGRHAAVVRLQALPAADGKSMKYVATAEYPAESLRREVVTRSISVRRPTPTDTP